MAIFVVRYWERCLDTSGNESRVLLGSETLDGVSEALLPGVSGALKVFCTKRFSSTAVDNWFVHTVEQSLASSSAPLTYEIVLEKPYVAAPIEYLSETLRKTGASLERTVRAGTLVEVDYGFIPAIGKDDGTAKGNERYCDTIQKGEMHKRRLCVVVKARLKRLQVVPVTSEVQHEGDKTAFEIDPESLAPLVRYGASGKLSYALSSMVETVSVNRVLPPESNYEAGRKSRQGRHTEYVHALTSRDLNKLKDSLLHVIGVTDYAQVKAALPGALRRCGELDGAQAYTAELEAKLAQLLPYQRLAEKWAKSMNCRIEDALRDL